VSQRIQMHRRALRILEEARAAGTSVASAELAAQAERGHQFAQALRHYGEAADHALSHFAPADAMALTGAAIKLLDRVPASEDCAELELGVVHRRGVAAAQLLGIGSTECTSSFERTLALCDALPPTPMRALLLSGLGLARYIRGDYAGSKVLAERALAIGDEHDNDVLRASAALLLGMIQAVRAEHQAARTTLEAGIAVCERIHQVPPGIFVIDPLAAMHANIAIPLMSLGLCDQARRHIEDARRRAHDIGQPAALMLSNWVDGMVHVRAEDPHRVFESAAALSSVVERSMLTQGGGPALWLRGWALARQGDPREGYRLVRQGFDIHARLEMFAGNTETLGYAAETLVLAGDWDGADRQLDEALALADRIHEHVMVPYLLRLRARVAKARESDARCREILLQSLAEARRQDSPFDELKSFVELVKQGLATPSERRALARTYASFPEGRDLPFLKEAARLLES
jgi:tetratricopeptide (TPR) repeat protein